MRFRFSIITFSLLVMAGYGRPMFAQLQTGTITGVVTDSQGAVLPGVTATLRSQALIQPQTTTTNLQGGYIFTALPPGLYALTLELAGFQMVEQQDIRVSVAISATVDMTLQLAGVTEAITVRASAPVVDVKNSITLTSFDRDLLENVPQANEIWSTVEASPGTTLGRYNVGGAESAQQTRMQVHGSTSGQTEYANSGLKLNWPGSDGGFVAMYFNHDSLEEVNLLTNGAPAEVATGGVYMNMVTRSGGNEFSGTTQALGTHESLQGDNVSDELKAQGVTGEPLNYLYYFSTNVGGPILRDKMWFFGSYLRYDIDRDVIGQPRPDGSPGKDINHQSNVTGKVTTQLNDENKLMVEYNWNMQNRFYRQQTGLRVEEVASWRQAPEPAWTLQSQWTTTPTDKLLLDFRYGYMHQIAPTHYQPEVLPTDRAREDVVRRTLRSASVRDNENFATRHQVNLSATYFVDDLGGPHNFKTGFEFGHVLNQDTRFTYGNLTQRYFDGVPFEVQTYNTPVSAKNNVNTTSFYGQDSWTVGRRLTVNYGARFERFVGYAPAQGLEGNEFFPRVDFERIDDIPNWNGFVWRLGASYALGEENRTAIKGFVGRYWVQDGTQLVQQVNPTTLSGDFRSWDDRNGNDLADFDELGPPTRPFGGNVNRIDPDILRPYSDEFTLGFDHELLESVSVSVTYFHRQNRRLYSGRNLLVPPSAYVPIEVDSPAGRITVFNQDPDTIGQADRIITNIEGLQNNYNGVEFNLTKRMADRWQLVAGYTVGKGEGIFVRGLNDDFNDPNDNINRAGSIINQDSTHIVKIIGTYLFPKDFTLSTNFRYFTGQPVEKQVRVTGLNQGSITVLDEPRGRTRLDNVDIWDLRLSKIFRADRFQFEAMVDFFNLLNSSPATAVINDVGPLFQQPLGILAPRIARLGVRFSF